MCGTGRLALHCLTSGPGPGKSELFVDGCASGKHMLKYNLSAPLLFLNWL